MARYTDSTFHSELDGRAESGESVRLVRAYCSNAECGTTRNVHPLAVLELGCLECGAPMRKTDPSPSRPKSA
jgi:hypothetical protein